MNLVDPVVAYIADNNYEASQVAHLLCTSDVEAFVDEDHSFVGLWAFGRLPQVHKPQVWIAKKDSQRAAELLREFDRQKEVRSKKQPTGYCGDIEVVCEECGKTSTFNIKLNGTVQECRHCRGHVDVGEFEWPYDDPEADSE